MSDEYKINKPTGRTDAVVEAAIRNHRKERDRRQKNRSSGGGPGNNTDPNIFRKIVKSVGVVVLLAFLALLFDGGRRELEEVRARYAKLAGDVTVRKPVSSNSTETKVKPATLKTVLANKDVDITGNQSNATIVFPDGSAIIQGPDTHFEIRLLDYDRRGRRGRYLKLFNGNIFTRISRFFGKDSQNLIATPNAVAAARGTGYDTQYNPATNTTVVEVIDSVVRLRNMSGSLDIPAGKRGVAVGNKAPFLDGDIPPARIAILQQQFNRLRTLERAPDQLTRWERGLLRFLDPLLQLIGWMPGRWDLGDNDAGRRLATAQALRRIQEALEGTSSGDVPERLSSFTLGELGIPELDKEKYLDTFLNREFESYQKRGQNKYTLRVRSRDLAHTPFELTESGVRTLDGSRVPAAPAKTK